MTAQRSITAADLRVGDRIVWPGDSLYNVAADAIEPVLSLASVAGRVEVVTRCNSMNRVRLMAADYSLRVLMPRPADEDTP